MKQIYLAFVLFLSLAGLVYAQEGVDFYETGKQVIGADFIDYEQGPLLSGGLTVVGIFADIPGNDTEVLEVEVPGGTTNSWDELLYANFDTPENSADITWRVQYRIRVQSAPYTVEMRMQINQDPWNGFTVTNTIPEAYKAKWIFFDYTAPPFVSFSTDQVNFSLRFGGQSYQLLHLDDLRLYISNALKIVGYETTSDFKSTRGFGAELETKTMDGAPEGFSVLNARLTGADNPKIVFGAFLNRDYASAYRLTLTMRSSSVPLTVKGGIANISDFSDRFLYAPDSQTITDKDQWKVLSFLIPAWPYGDKRLYSFIEFDKPGAEVLVDRAAILKTDEKIEGPVAIQEWSLF